MGGLLPLDREQHRRRGGDGHRQDNRAGAAGQRRHAGQVFTGEAQHKADEHQPRHNAAFARGRDDDGQNIPYSTTLSALTTRSGSRLPAMMPSAVPIAQAGAASRMAP